MAGMLGRSGVAYSATKSGLRGVSQSAVLELLQWNIRVNSIHPAQVSATLINANSTPGYRYAAERVIPLKRASRPDEIVSAVLFLASEEASDVKGTELIVDGGTLGFGLSRIRAMLEDDYSNSHAEK